MDERELHISGSVFVYACLALVCISLVAGALGLGIGFWTLRDSGGMREQLFDKQEQLRATELSLAAVNGRVQAFEALLITTQHTAIEASLKAFERETGKAPTQAGLAEYDTWLRRK